MPQPTADDCFRELEPEESRQARVFKQFASFEERHGEYERARVIYKHAIKLLRLGEKAELQKMQDDEEITEQERIKREELYKSYVAFEKKHGDREGIEDVILTKQRGEYERRLKDDPLEYDAWFEYAKLEEEHGLSRNAMAVYDRAVRTVTLAQRLELVRHKQHAVAYQGGQRADPHRRNLPLELARLLFDLPRAHLRQAQGCSQGYGRGGGDESNQW